MDGSHGPLGRRGASHDRTGPPAFGMTRSLRRSPRHGLRAAAPSGIPSTLRAREIGELRALQAMAAQLRGWTRRRRVFIHAVARAALAETSVREARTCCATACRSLNAKQRGWSRSEPLHDRSAPCEPIRAETHAGACCRRARDGRLGRWGARGRELRRRRRRAAAPPRARRSASGSIESAAGIASVGRCHLVANAVRFHARRPRGRGSWMRAGDRGPGETPASGSGRALRTLRVGVRRSRNVRDRAGLA